MFTGIVEALAVVTDLKKEGGNLHITLRCPFTEELKVDQSIAHNGVCLTVVRVEGDRYTVTAIDETLRKSNLGDLKIGSEVNLERSMKLGDRLDGHIVQGHVDQTGECVSVQQQDGSWVYRFRYDEPLYGNVTIPKGSIAVNGTSLTGVDSEPGEFSVAIIPYTYEHTNFHTFVPGTKVNLEFDVIGKYAARLLGK